MTHLITQELIDDDGLPKGWFDSLIESECALFDANRITCPNCGLTWPKDGWPVVNGMRYLVCPCNYPDDPTIVEAKE